MKLGFFTANFTEKPLEDVAKLAADYGYELLEIPAYEGNGQLEPKEILKGNNAAALKKMVASYGLGIAALSNHPESFLIMGPGGVETDFIMKGTKEEKVAFGTEGLIRTAQAANALEVPVVVGYPGIDNWGRFFPFPYGQGWADYEAEFAAKFVPILDKFKEYGVKFAIEPHPNSFVYDIYTAEKAIELVDHHPCLGYNLDPANIIYLGLRVENFIDRLGDRIFHVHAKDGEIVEHNMPTGGILMQGDWQRLDRTFRFRIPGWGSVPWKKVITELSMVGYHGVLSYEHEDVTMSRMDGVEKTAAFLKPLLIKAPYEGRTDKLFSELQAGKVKQQY
ncbi:sugar phosphate isomerase/epimerase [Hydrogenispora ethanolica]|uniref:Sugar phosphate isomerase/epimerase n=1 Tax=Hydrogenispora ethanolica TaxID=1082276 RepID=A0A4R1SDA8_HYDET|nr:sugar phosphate isomerase/epimerase [Hydrogenispora ethanolica]TCL77020.1 sugar phosphate isomerase/epimerase [Hydrogenispora ethanolica]